MSDKTEHEGPITLVTKDEPKQLEHKWELYWFHYSDPDASCRASVKTLVDCLSANDQLRAAVLEGLDVKDHGIAVMVEGWREKLRAAETAISESTARYERTLLDIRLAAQGEKTTIDYDSGAFVLVVELRDLLIKEAAKRALVKADLLEAQALLMRFAGAQTAADAPWDEVEAWAKRTQPAARVVEPVPAKVTLRLPYMKHPGGLGSADLVLEDVSVAALADNGFVPQVALGIALDQRNAAQARVKELEEAARLVLDQYGYGEGETPPMHERTAISQLAGIMLDRTGEPVAEETLGVSQPSATIGMRRTRQHRCSVCRRPISVEFGEVARCGHCKLGRVDYDGKVPAFAALPEPVAEATQHTCINTATTIDGQPPPACPACLADPERFGIIGHTPIVPLDPGAAFIAFGPDKVTPESLAEMVGGKLGKVSLEIAKLVEEIKDRGLRELKHRCVERPDDVAIYCEACDAEYEAEMAKEAVGPADALRRDLIAALHRVIDCQRGQAEGPAVHGAAAFALSLLAEELERGKGPL